MGRVTYMTDMKICRVTCKPKLLPFGIKQPLITRFISQRIVINDQMIKLFICAAVIRGEMFIKDDDTYI